MDSRVVPLGGLRAMNVWRTLPQRGKAMIGAWCFLDHYGPDPVEQSGGMHVSRHPHTGLATVSWLFEGQINHLDSAGNEALVVPHELNLMVAGRGITHQEISSPDTTTLHGVQLWYALPDSTRFNEHGFAHFAPEQITRGAVTARVFIGEHFGARSPVETSTTELLGAELIILPNCVVELDLRPEFEYGLLAENTSFEMNETHVDHRQLGYISTGHTSVRLATGPVATRIILLGGVPFEEEIVMWWNFIGRTHEEIVDFRNRYQSELGFESASTSEPNIEPLYGPFPDGQPDAIPAPVMPITRLKPRK